MSVRVTIAGAASETGKLLVDYLKAAGIYDARSQNVVCYGQPATGAHVLNDRCGLDKIERLKIMKQAGVSTVRWTDDVNVAKGFSFPLYARKANGYGAKDLMPVFQAEELAWRKAAGWDWFSEYVPVKHELRVYVFRGKVLEVFEKVMEHPENYISMGRNFGQGFEFKVDNSITSGNAEAKKAVEALEFDFGAVDLIVGKNGQAYVLEVNTAPGVIRSGAQATLKKLVAEIKAWDAAGHPARSY